MLSVYMAMYQVPPTKVVPNMSSIVTEKEQMHGVLITIIANRTFLQEQLTLFSLSRSYVVIQLRHKLCVR
jgi:hypothetical protein